MGGMRSLFTLFLVFFGVAYSIYFTFHCRSRDIILKKRNLKDNIYQTWLQKDDNQTDKPTEKDFSLNDRTIWSHTYRMYLVGQNTDYFPWIIPKDFPKDVLAKQDRERFLKFIDSYNPSFTPTFVDVLLNRMIKVIYPPLAQYFIKKVREKRFLDLQVNLFRYFPP
jgi:hypothetical protein